MSPAPSSSAHARFGDVPAEALGAKWAALAGAAEVIALLAGIDPRSDGGKAGGLATMIRDAEPWRREMADQAIGDLAAVLEYGMAALLAVNARGADLRPAALALWREFSAGRAAILALMPAGKGLRRIA